MYAVPELGAQARIKAQAQPRRTAQETRKALGPKVLAPTPHAPAFGNSCETITQSAARGCGQCQREILFRVGPPGSLAIDRVQGQMPSGTLGTDVAD